MAIREIRKQGDNILAKVCRPVTRFDNKLCILLDDMYETMQKNEGVGLAGPQVGILRRIVVIDVGEGLIEMINPEIIETEGSQIDAEGCLSAPGLYGEVERPMRVKAKAQDREGRWFEIEGEALLARAICHECDHLDGKMFTSKVIRYVEEEKK